ncbi:glycosyltransferase [Candidatus Saccharibacteria bacterium]|nr:glycosyltransferase [Candidatus Saccharibacteria bacterium]
MKIAFFTDAYLDITGGVRTAVEAQKKTLEDLGHTVYLFSPGFKRSDTKLKQLAKQNIFVVPTCRFFIRGVIPTARRPRLVEKWILKQHPEIKGFDVFHVHYEAGCSIAGIRLAHQFKIPVVQTMHGREDVGLESLIPFGLRTFVGVSLDWFHSWYLPHDVKVKKDDFLAPTRARANMWSLMANHANQVDLVLTPSAHFKKKLMHYGVRRPVEVMPNGVADAHFEEHVVTKTLLPGEPMRIIWHNRVNSEKRLSSFLEALRLTNGKYKMDVFGDGNELGKVRRMVERYDMPIKIHGATTFEELVEKLRKSHLDVLTSYNYDTFGMTLIEAEVAGVPAFFCDPDMEEIAAPGGYVKSDGVSVEAMADSLKDLMEHPERIEKMSAAMLKHRDEVRQSERIKKLIAYYQDVIKKAAA